MTRQLIKTVARVKGGLLLDDATFFRLFNLCSAGIAGTGSQCTVIG